MDNLGYIYTHALEPTLLFSPGDAVCRSPMIILALAFMTYPYALVCWAPKVLCPDCICPAYKATIARAISYGLVADVTYSSHHIVR